MLTQRPHFVAAASLLFVLVALPAHGVSNRIFMSTNGTTPMTVVREEGFEPSRVTPRDPKSRASASSATLASDTSVSARHFGFNE
jgi:hypothetical protein